MAGWRFPGPGWSATNALFRGILSEQPPPGNRGKARRPGIIPDGLLARLRRRSKRWPLLSAISPFGAVGFNPVLRRHSPLLFPLQMLPRHGGRARPVPRLSVCGLPWIELQTVKVGQFQPQAPSCCKGCPMMEDCHGNLPLAPRSEWATLIVGDGSVDLNIVI